MDIFAKIVVKIIEQQEGIIGPIALEQAKKVDGLSVNWNEREVELSGDEKEVVNHLVSQYEHLFGRASVEVCREAVKEMLADLPADKRPEALQ